MKCSKCGFRARDIAGLARHYRKKHPGAMKARRRTKPKAQNAPRERASSYSFCPHCGGKL